MTDTSAIWDRLPGEPAGWFDRFAEFKQLGRGRTLLAVFHAEQAQRGRPEAELSRTVPGVWNRMARDWQWWDRAVAWDDDQRSRRDATLAELADESDARLRGAMSQAVDTLIALLDSTDHRVRLGAATQILDRTGVEATSRQEMAHTLRRARELSDDELTALIAQELAVGGGRDPDAAEPGGVSDGAESAA